MKTPLHQAVIDDDQDTFAALDLKQWNHVKDEHGFTPLDLARFLGRRHFQKFLGGSFPTSFRVQKRGEDHVETLGLTEFESFFDFTYCPYLTFGSYKELIKVQNHCPWLLRSPSLADFNYTYARRYKREMDEGYTAPVYVKWINEKMGYGLFASQDIEEGSYIGEYAGEVRRISRFHPDLNGYCFHYPTKFWSMVYYVIDSQKIGNLLRFANHSEHPHMVPQCAVENRLLHTIFITGRFVTKDTQLTFDYGQDYWVRRDRID